MSVVEISKLDTTRIDPRSAIDFTNLLASDFARIPDISPEDAKKMSNRGTGNSIAGIRRVTESPNKANFYLASTADYMGPLAAAKIGLERYGDRPDASKIQYQLMRAAHKLDLLKPDTAQVFAWGSSSVVSPEDAQDMFNRVLGQATGELEVEQVSAFVDTKDDSLASLMDGYAGITNRSVTVGGKAIELSVGGVERLYRRHLVS